MPRSKSETRAFIPGICRFIRDTSGCALKVDDLLPTHVTLLFYGEVDPDTKYSRFYYEIFGHKF